MASQKLIVVIVQVLLICSILLQAAATKYITYDALKRGNSNSEEPKKRSVPPIKVSSSGRRLGPAEKKPADSQAINNHVKKIFAQA